MQENDDLVKLMLSGLSPLAIEDVVGQGELIWGRARTPDGPAACPGCGTGSMHGYQWRAVADVPIDAHRVVVGVRVRRLVCPIRGCVQAFREQLPGVLERHQHRTPRLTSQIAVVVRELAGRAGTRLSSALGVPPSRHTALRALLRLPLPERPVPRVLGVDDFAPRKHRSHATALIDAQTRQRIDVPPDRRADTPEAWLREHPGIQVVCRDGSGAYAEAVRRTLPDAVQVGDR